MSARPGANRLAQVDTLRALAALLVACAHIWERFLPYSNARGSVMSKTWPRYFDFGITGVVLFFCISGFVIYGTLRGPRKDAGRRFVISRFFRLYPAYWVSVAGSNGGAGLAPGRSVTRSTSFISSLRRRWFGLLRRRAAPHGAGGPSRSTSRRRCCSRSR